MNFTLPLSNCILPACTQGELEHQHVKRNYAHTNKNGATRQITRLEWWEKVLQRISQNQRTLPQMSALSTRSSHAQTTVNFDESEPLPATPPDYHHHISHSWKFPLNVASWIVANQGNVATKVRNLIVVIIWTLYMFTMSRNSYPGWRTISSNVCYIQIKHLNAASILQKNLVRLHCRTTAYSATRFSE